MILLALGSNVGNREAYLQRACDALDGMGIRVVKRSSLLETPAMLPPGAPLSWDVPFVKLVVQVLAEHEPEALLAQVKTIEQELGRVDRGRWGPREIDIDILVYHDEICSSASLTLPHPGIALRDFVLRPIAEIAPHWRHPVTHLSAREMLA
jgi:2-amino-4-hydroxy-6-hydroxymethyldihydropteridine diphosphokinase